jgi:hypothetical protein
MLRAELLKMPMIPLLPIEGQLGRFILGAVFLFLGMGWGKPQIRVVLKWIFIYLLILLLLAILFFYNDIFPSYYPQPNF